MTIDESYTSLARMLGYPRKKEMLQIDCACVSRFLGSLDLVCPLEPFADFVAASTLATLQEGYVATFDFNPAVALYLGHHLYGDNQKKTAYMIRLKQEYDRCGFAPATNELPDHLPLVLGFLAHLVQQKNDILRRAFISECVLLGMTRLSAAFAGGLALPWGAAVEAGKLLCVADAAACEEEITC